jgi:tape measure domain-containing protein
MAKLGDLVVRIGADTRDLNKSLGRVQRNMRSMTSNFTQLGQTMTRSLTLPLAAFGAAAVKSAADLEALETSFVSLTGSARGAADMMNQLNEFTANTPFQIEAVATAARQLIASGTEISQVNEQLQFLGDIAATTGVSIDEIAAIFAKVNAKGKVELENLNQLAERGIPIFKALSEATGLPADKLGAGAVSVRDFNRVLKSFAEQGGFAAGAMERLSNTAAGKFSTAMDNLKIAGAAMGESILPKVTKLLDKITETAQGFAGLDPSIRALIVNLGFLAAAFGPVLAFLPQIITQIKLIMVTLSGGGIAVAVAALGVLITTFTTLRNEVVTIQDRLNDAQRDANKNAAKSIADVRVLVAEFKKEGTQMERKEEILRRLQEISPRYYGHLEDATVTVDLLTAATERYTESIKAQARQQAIQEAQTEQYTAIANAQRRVLDLERERIELLQELDTNLSGVVGLQEAAAKPFKFESYRVLGGALQAAQAEVQRLTDELLQFQQQFDAEGGLVAIEEELANINEESRNAFRSVTLLVGSMTTLAEILKDTRRKTKDAKIEIEEFDAAVDEVDDLDFTFDADKVIKEFERARNAARDFAFSINQAVESAVESMLMGVAQMVGASIALGRPLENVGVMLGDMLANLAIELGEYAIAHGVAIEAIKKSLLSLNGVTAIAAGIALIAIGSGLKARMQKISSDAGIPALAEGGLAYGPTTALIGDNRNARIDPEVVAPLSKLRDMMGGNQVEVFGRISGNDIFLSNARTGTSRNRYA